MNSNEIELRLRILRGDVLRVVKFNILGQKQLEDDEHAFLYTHTERLDAASLVHWLAYKPSHVSPIVDALVALIPSGHEGTLLAAYEIGPRAAHMSREAIRLLAERLLPRLAPRGWWHVAQHLDDGCPTFTALLAEPRGCELAAALFRYRDNEEACCSALRRLLGQLDLAARAHAIAWLESRGLLALVEPGDVLPTEVAFAFERDALADEGEEDSGRFFLDLALRWHGAGALVARDWYITQVLAAVKRGMPWVQLARALPVDVLDDVALRSFEAPPIAPWIWMVIEDAIERGDPDAWPRAFSLIDRSEATLGDGDHDHDPDLEPCVFYAHRKGRAAHLSGQMGPTIILFHSSPPADADEEFEERVRLRAERPGLRGHALLWLNGRDGALFHRFASFPLTQERANRLMRWAVRKPRLFRGAGEIIIRLAQIADPLPPEALPAVTVFFPERPSPALLDAYRRLGGKAAEERLIAWMSAPIDGLEPLDEALPRSPEDLWLMTFDRAEVLPDLVTDDLRRKLGDGIGALQLRSLLSVHREAPWLLDEAQLVARVMDRADDLDDRWMVFSSDKDLPAILAPAVRRRVPFVRREDELVILLDWLVRHGDAPDDLIRLVLARGIGAPHDERTIQWLATVLVTTSRWKTFGPPILKQLLAAEAWEAMTMLLVESVKNEKAITDPDRTRGIVGAIHEAIAVVLLHRLREATETGADGDACAALRGLAAVQPPARLSQQLHLLRKKHELPPDVLELVNLNLSLLRHGTTRGAQLFDAQVALNLYRESATLASEG